MQHERKFTNSRCIIFYQEPLTGCPFPIILAPTYLKFLPLFYRTR